MWFPNGNPAFDTNLAQDIVFVWVVALFSSLSVIGAGSVYVTVCRYLIKCVSISVGELQLANIFVFYNIARSGFMLVL